jgi:hypothetical protein
MAWVKLNDWRFVDGHSAKALPDGFIVLLPKLGNRWGLSIKSKTGRVSVSRATYSTPDRAQRAAWDWCFPPSGELAGLWRDDAGRVCAPGNGKPVRKARQAGVGSAAAKSPADAPGAVWRKPGSGVCGSRGRAKSRAPDTTSRVGVKQGHQVLIVGNCRYEA